jgi:hypothetical protein
VEINGKHSITGARRAVVAASREQRVGKIIGQFEGVGKKLSNRLRDRVWKERENTPTTHAIRWGTG